MLQIAVCDDEAIILDMLSKRIKREFEKLGHAVTISNFQYGVELRRRIFSGVRFDVLFLDIDMKDINGIELSKHLRENHTQSLIIFISNREEYVFKSFSVSPFRFVRKMDFEEEITEIIKDTIKELNREETNLLMLETNNTCLKINPYEIVYVECNNKTLRIVSEKTETEIKYKLSELEERLNEYGFIKTHKGFLVNYRYIFSIEKTEVVLDTRERIPLSKYRLGEVKEKFRRLTLC